MQFDYILESHTIRTVVTFKKEPGPGTWTEVGPTCLFPKTQETGVGGTCSILKSFICFKQGYF